MAELAATLMRPFRSMSCADAGQRLVRRWRTPGAIHGGALALVETAAVAASLRGAVDVPVGPLRLCSFLS